MKKRYLAAGVLGSIAAGAVVYKKIKPKKDSNVIMYPICRVTMHIDYPIYKLNKLVKKSEVIIKGVVEEISEAKWNNKDNKQPKNISNKDVIYKDYFIKISQIFKGNIKENEILKLRSFEGEINGFTIEDNNQIVLENGQEIVAFLNKDTSNYNREKSQDYYVPYGEKQGVYLLNESKIKNINEELDVDIFNKEIENLLNE